MKLLVISDNHGNVDEMLNILREEEYDVSIHCGDFELPDKDIKKMFDYVVPGNNDFSSNIEKELKIKIKGIKIFITHGHYYQEGKGMSSEEFEYKNGSNYNLVLFGHIHYPSNKKVNNTIYVNPGSISYPRYASKKSYATIEIVQNIIKNIKHKTI